MLLSILSCTETLRLEQNSSRDTGLTVQNGR